MKSWRARLLALLTAVAMILTLSGTAAMADVDRHGNDNGIFNNNGDDNGIFNDNGDDCIGVGGGSEEDCIGVFLGDNDNNNDELDTIDVGPLVCLVDENDVIFCVDEDTGQRVFV